MKTKLFIVAIVVATIATFGFTKSKQTNEAQCHYGYCGAIKNDGMPCHNCAQQGSYYCWSHGR